MFARLAFLVLCVLVLPAAAAPLEKPVYRVDSVIATLRRGFITIQSKGAVQSGGWKAARLRAGHGDAHTLVVNFLAQPPAPDAAVISGLLPVAASARFRARRGVVAVRVVAEANDVTTQILP